MLLIRFALLIHSSWHAEAIPLILYRRPYIVNVFDLFAGIPEAHAHIHEVQLVVNNGAIDCFQRTQYRLERAKRARPRPGMDVKLNIIFMADSDKVHLVSLKRLFGARVPSIQIDKW